MEVDQAAKKCIGAAILTAVAFICLVFLFDMSKWWLAFTVLAFYPLALLYGFLYGMFFFRQEDLQALTEEDQAEMEEALDARDDQEHDYFFEEVEDTEFSESVVGRFKDADIHEFVLVNHPNNPNQKLKCTFSHVVDDIERFQVPTGCWFVLLLPGIVYTAPAEPEFTGGESSSLE